MWCDLRQHLALFDRHRPAPMRDSIPASSKPTAAPIIAAAAVHCDARGPASVSRAALRGAFIGVGTSIGAGGVAIPSAGVSARLSGGGAPGTWLPGAG
jgi:hypothetical protein